MAWYSKASDEVIRDLDTDINNGLSNDTIQRRRERFGSNSSGGKKYTRPDIKPWLRSILPAALICLTVAALYLLTKCYVHFTVVLVITALTILLKLYVYNHASHTLHDADIASRTAVTVTRGGTKRMVEQSDLVPGDVVCLKPGDIITADLRLVETRSLFINESHLPGGFINSPKSASAKIEEDDSLPLSAHTNMCYSGSSVMSGSGKGIVVETGASSVVMPSLVPETQSPFEYDSRLLTRQSRRFSIAAVSCCIAVFVIGLLSREFSTDNFAYMFVTCSGLAAAVTPLAFTLCEILLLSVGMNKLSRRGISIKSFRALRDISRTEIFVVQKTGVVTSQDMTATRLWTGGELIDVRGHGWSPEGRFENANGEEINISRNRSAALALIGGTLCGNSDIEETSHGKWTYRGDPTEGALAALAAKAGLFRADVNEMFPRIAEYPYDSVRRLMATVHKRGRQIVVYVKGTTEAVLERCVSLDIGGKAYGLTDYSREQINNICESMTKNGLRTIAIAYREMNDYSDDAGADDVENELILCGIVGIENRVAPSSVSAYNLCNTAGIRTFIVTDDDVSTATDTALAMGIHENVLDAREFEKMSDDELAAVLAQSKVAANVDSVSKARIVNILRRTGSFVTFAGSDPSDAEAMLAANIGIAAGSTSSELSRKTSQIIMDDGSFGAITRIIEESRRIFTSLKAYTGYVMTSSFALILTMLIYAFSSGAMPFTALQLFWMNVILLAIPVFTIGRDANVHSVMHSRPRTEGEAVLNLNTIVSAFVQSLIPMALTIASIAIASKRTDDAAVVCCTAFITMVLSLVMLAHPNRSSKASLARLGIFTNRPLILLTAAVFAFLIAAVNIPVFRTYFDAVPVSFMGWLFAVIFAFVCFVWGELFKAVIRPVIDKLIKDTPLSTGHRKRVDSNISERFFAKFEGADPTQEEDAYEPLFRKNEVPGENEEYSEELNAVEETDTAPVAEKAPVEISDDTGSLRAVLVDTIPLDSIAATISDDDITEIIDDLDGFIAAVEQGREPADRIIEGEHMEEETVEEEPVSESAEEMVEEEPAPEVVEEAEPAVEVVSEASEEVEEVIPEPVEEEAVPEIAEEVKTVEEIASEDTTEEIEPVEEIVFETAEDELSDDVEEIIYESAEGSVDEADDITAESIEEVSIEEPVFVEETVEEVIENTADVPEEPVEERAEVVVESVEEIVDETAVEYSKDSIIDEIANAVTAGTEPTPVEADMPVPENEEEPAEAVDVVPVEEAEKPALDFDSFIFGDASKNDDMSEVINDIDAFFASAKAATLTDADKQNADKNDVSKIKNAIDDFFASFDEDK